MSAIKQIHLLVEEFGIVLVLLWNRSLSAAVGPTVGPPHKVSRNEVSLAVIPTV